MQFFYCLFQISPCLDEFVAYLLCHLISEAVFDAAEHLVVEDAIKRREIGYHDDRDERGTDYTLLVTDAGQFICYL